MINLYKTIIWRIVLLVFFADIHTVLSGQANACFDSVSATVSPVRCFSFRDGVIRIDSVYGGIAPYYYSISGVTYSTRPVFDRLWPGTYTITIRDSVGCTESYQWTVQEPAALTVTLHASATEINRGESVALEATVSPSIGVKYKWRPPELFEIQDTNRQEVRLTVSKPLAVEVVDSLGCTATDQVWVDVVSPDLYFPNIIQIGSNQDAYFTVFSSEGAVQINRLQIYHRSGALLFERTNFPPNDPLLGWGGFFQGQRVESGVYTWLATIRFADGKLERFEGDVTVLR
jgi:hypothetical protein